MSHDSLSILQPLLTTLEWDEVLRRLPETLYKVMPSLQGVGIWLRDKNTEVYKRIQYQARLAHQGYSVDEVVVEDFPSTQTPCLAPTPYPFLAKDAWIQESLLVPLYLEKLQVGYLDLYTDSQFSDEEIEHLTTLSPYLASALYHASVHHKEQEHRNFNELLNRISMAINSSLDLNKVIEQVLVNAQSVVPYDTADIRIIRGEQLEIIGSRGFNEAFTLPPTSHIQDWQTYPLMMQVYRTAQPVIVHDTHHDSLWKAHERFGWIRSHLKVPIALQGTVIGFLNLDSSRPHFFTSTHAAMMQPFADQAAIALRNAQIYRTEREQRRFSEALSETARILNGTLDLDKIINQILDSVTHAIQPETCSLMLLEDGFTKTVSSRGYEKLGLKEWIHAKRMEVQNVPNLRRSMETGHPIITKDTLHDPDWMPIAEDAWIRSHVDVSIQIEGKVIGFLNMDSTQPNAFTEQDAQWLQAFANQAAVALRNAQLFAAEHEQRKLIEALNASAALLNSTLMLDTVFENILKIVGQVVSHNASNIMLIDADGYTNTIAQRGYEKYGAVALVKNLHFKVADVPDMQKTLERQEVTLIPDTYEYEAWIESPKFGWVRSHLKAPILVEGAVIGFLQLDSETPHFFTEKHTQLIRGFTDQAAVAIRNAQLFSAEREQRLLNEALNESGALLNSTLMLDKVIENILEIVGRVVPHDASNIMLIDEEGYTRTIAQHGYKKYNAEDFTQTVRFNVTDTQDMRITMESGVVRIIPDTHIYNDWIELDKIKWIRSHLKAPILIEGRVTGFIHLDSATPHFFTEKHAEHIRGFAEQAATAIRNAQLFSAEHDQRMLNEALNETAVLLNSTLDLDKVFDNILQIVGKVVPHETSNFMLVDGEYTRTIGTQGYEKYNLTEMVRNLRFKIDDTPDFKRARDYGEIRLIKDTNNHLGWKGLEEAPWIRSHLKAPIQVDGKTIGFISLDSSQTNFFTEKHAALMHLFSEQAALAIKNAQLFTAEHEQKLVNEALQSTASSLSSSLELSQVINIILENVVRVVPHETSTIMLIDDGFARVLGSKGFELYGLQDWIKDFAFEIATTPNIRAKIELNRAFIIPDTHEDPLWAYVEETSWIRSSLSAPIYIDNEIIGFLNLDSTKPHFFQEKHINWLTAFADQAALAIKNARLFAAEREQRRLNEALRATAQLINSTLQLDTVIERILETAEQVVPHEASNIMVIEKGITRTLGSRGFEKYGLKEWISNIRLNIDDYPNLKNNLRPRKAHIFTDTHASHDWVIFPETEWTRSNVLMPIYYGEDLIGILNLDSSEPGFFKEEQAVWIEAFAEQAAIAIRNAQLFAELDQERAHLAAILDATNEGILYIEDNVIKYVNQSFINMTGYHSSEVLDHTLGTFVDLPSEQKDRLGEQFFRELRQHGYFRRRDLHMKRNTDESLSVDVTCTAISQSPTLRAVLVVRDISHEKVLQVRQHRFITHAAHELRHPLANFITRLYLLRRKPHELEENLSRLEANAQRMTDIIEDMLEVARFGQGQISMNLTATPMQEVIQEVVANQQEIINDFHVEVQTHLPPDPIYALLDRKLFSELASTLLVDAITYSGENSRIEIALTQEKKDAVMSIKDSGQPLPKEQLDQFFEPFHRPSAGNVIRTGLELTIAEYIVTQHNGTIAIQNSKSGNTITVKLPLSSESAG